MKGGPSGRKWMTSLLVAGGAALVLSACSAPAGGRADLPVAQGMHLLADAELRYEVTGAGLLSVAYVVNLVNGGTETCTNLFNTIHLPPQLARHEERGGWSGVVQPFDPGHRGSMTGDMQFREFALPAQEELETWLSEATITVSSGSGYNNTVAPTVARGLK